MRKVKVAIIGAGTAGLSARREIAKVTDDYVVIDDGILGTTCARVGCMPSKVLIQVASDYSRRFKLGKEGIQGGENLKVNGEKVMEHVRSLRDRFVRGVIGDMDDWSGEKLIRKRAKFIDQHTLDLGDEQLEAETIIIATGSKPIFPEAWRTFEKFFIDTDQIFEMKSLPESLAVIGLGVIGLELGQAFNRLGVDVLGIGRSRNFSGISDPDIRDYAVEQIGSEVNLSFKGAEFIEERNGKLLIRTGNREFLAEKVLLAMGRNPVLTGLGIENLNLALDDRGVPKYNPNTYQIEGTDIYLVGDVNGERAILHEASDEGRIAGYNAVREQKVPYQRRVAMAVTFTSPMVAMVGKTMAELKAEGREFEVGEVTYEGQGRAIVMLSESGLLHVYGDKHTGEFLGAEMIAPHGDHLAHLLAWAIEKKSTVNEILSFPFYHPVLEEGVRTAFRNLASKLKVPRPDLEMRKLES